MKARLSYQVGAKLRNGITTAAARGEKLWVLNGPVEAAAGRFPEPTLALIALLSPRWCGAEPGTTRRESVPSANVARRTGRNLSGLATGRKLTKPVCHYTLNWSPEEHPERQEMSRAVTGSLQALGLDQNQALIVDGVNEDMLWTKMP